MGAQNRDNNEARIAWATFYIETARNLGLRTVWWDNGGIGALRIGVATDQFALFNRRTIEPTQPDLINAMMEAVAATPSR
jgi:hypothetical protein